nr:MAG TPA: hypothetical protein [Caudoviricetes sp.]
MNIFVCNSIFNYCFHIDYVFIINLKVFVCSELPTQVLSCD